MLFEFKEISKSYPNGTSTQCIFDRVTFQIKAGQFCAITGESGVGKSTLLSLLAGIERPSGGQLLFCNQDISNYTEQQLARYRNQSIGIVFQKPIYVHYLNVLENILLPSRYFGRTPNLRDEAVKIAKLVGLHAHLDKVPNVLSGGELQRLSFARAVLFKPKVILADEPTASLDLNNSKILLAMLAEQVDRGTTVIMVSHQDNAIKYATSRIHLDKTESNGAIISIL